MSHDLSTTITKKNFKANLKLLALTLTRIAAAQATKESN